ncbi:MAG TPA: hypothetical protein VGF16_02745 [Bryobacteraceae bacterium]
MKSTLRISAMLLAAAVAAPAARLTPTAGQAFEHYVAGVENRVLRQQRPRISEGELKPDAVRIEAVNGGSWEVDGGLLHHWRAAAFVPAATPAGMLAVLEDYDHLARYYSPDVVSSQLLTGGVTNATLRMRFRKRRIVTVVLDAEFDVQSGLAGPHRGYSLSRSTHVWQVDQPGTSRERRRAEGADDGFLWRLNSYWTFEEARGGLIIECEAVSLTRDVPAGLGWLIAPIVQTLPRDSLEFTLTATKNALAANAGRRLDDRAN